MNYICKNCGKYITSEEFKRFEKHQSQALGCGCLIWLIILLCCVSIILLPIAIILIVKEFNKSPNFICPYCSAENSIIPEYTPIAKKFIKDNFTPEQLEEIENIKKNQCKIEKKDKELEQKNNGYGLGIFLFFVICWLLSQIFK